MSLKDDEKKTVIRRSTCGKGLFLTESVNRIQVVIEYGGEQISAAESDRREKFYGGGGITDDYMMTLGSGRAMDATVQGNASIYANHSCDSNCEFVEEHVGRYTVVFIGALRRVTEMSEITVDYDLPMEPNAADRIRCKCGTRKCRNFLC